MKKIIFCATSLLIGSTIIADEPQKNITTEEATTFIARMYDKGLQAITYLKETAVPLAQNGVTRGLQYVKDGAQTAWVYTGYGVSCAEYFAGGAYYGATTAADQEATKATTWPQQGEPFQVQCANAGDAAGIFVTKQRSTNIATMSAVFLGGLLFHWGLNKRH
jgi:hypothetical protein